MNHQAIYHSKIGQFRIIEEEGYITSIQYINAPLQEQNECRSEVLGECIHQLDDYFEGKRKQFTLPLCPKGTPFQKRVWQALMAIPYGQTMTYQEVAKKIGNEKACRAVGMANHCNPIPIIIPCHRVLGKNQRLTGYALGIEKKQILLELEKEHAL